MMNPVGVHDPNVAQGLRPSGTFALKVLADITKEYHSYNSNANQKVKKTLANYAKAIENDFLFNWGCTQPNPFEILVHDPINMYVENFGALNYLESDNLVVHVKGASNSSLLVSSHFDSVVESHGATDDGAGLTSI